MRIFIFIILLLLPLSASEGYGRIIITKTSSQNSLKFIKQKLDATHTKMFISKSGNYYKVYSQIFQDKESATNALERVKEFFPYARIIPYTHTTNTENANDFFVALAFGEHKLTGDHTIETDGRSYTLEVGYNYTQHINATLAYLNTPTKDAELHNIYTALNYNFDIDEDFYIYTGGLIGYSTFKLENFTESSASSAILLGIQTGLIYNFNHHIGFYTAYQGLSLGHKVDIVDTTGTTSNTIEINFLHNLQIGIRYSF